MKKHQPNAYMLSCKIPEYAASGEYRVVEVRTDVANLNKYFRDPAMLHDLTITVINDNTDPIPTLTGVRLIP